jgi:hypothetical protein
MSYASRKVIFPGVCPGPDDNFEAQDLKTGRTRALNDKNTRLRALQPISWPPQN